MNKLAVLLVDDEKKFLDSIAQRIRLKGFEPMSVESGEEALEIARETKFHAAVVDLKMPGMDGLTTIAKLKEIDPGIKTVLLTGYGNEKIKEAAEALDSAYFEKDEMRAFWDFIKQFNPESGMIIIPPPFREKETGTRDKEGRGSSGQRTPSFESIEMYASPHSAQRRSSFVESPQFFRIYVLIYIFLSILIFICMLLYKYQKIPSRLTKLKIRVVLFGFFIGVLLPFVEPILNSTLGIFILPNIEMATLPFITVFPLSIAYAIVKHDLFEIDIFIKRTAGYLIATASIALCYLLFVFSANLFLKTIFLQHQHLVNFLFVLIVIFFFNPITNNIQVVVNRLFFRQKYDYKEPVKQLLKDITSLFELDLIIRRVLNILANTMFIEAIHIFLYNHNEDVYFEYNPQMNTTHNPPDKLISSSSHLVKLLITEKKEITRDSFYDLLSFSQDLCSYQ